MHIIVCKLKYIETTIFFKFLFSAYNSQLFNSHYIPVGTFNNTNMK